MLYVWQLTSLRNASCNQIGCNASRHNESKDYLADFADAADLRSG